MALAASKSDREFALLRNQHGTFVLVSASDMMALSVAFNHIEMLAAHKNSTEQLLVVAANLLHFVRKYKAGYKVFAIWSEQFGLHQVTTHKYLRAAQLVEKYPALKQTKLPIAILARLTTAPARVINELVSYVKQGRSITRDNVVTLLNSSARSDVNKKSVADDLKAEITYLEQHIAAHRFAQRGNMLFEISNLSF